MPLTNLLARFLILICLLTAWCAVTYAQQSAGGNAIVKGDGLNVYAEMQTASAVVQSLAKGTALVVNMEFTSAGITWCWVTLPGQAVRLGYVLCQGLERADHGSGGLLTPKEASQAPASPSSTAGKSPVRSAIHLPPTRPPAESTTEYERVAAAVAHEGVLHHERIMEFEEAAKGGSPLGTARAALAHIAAAHFELSSGDTDLAITEFQAALPFAAKQPQIQFALLLNLSYVHLVRSEYSTALGLLERARELAPKSVPVAQLSGWALYGLNRIDEAVQQWKAAQSFQPNAYVAALLEKAERDQAAESSARERESQHFNLRYQGSASPFLAAEVLRTLEQHFQTIQTDLHFTPTEAIGVVLYTEQAYRDITRAPNWAGAANDGRIRVPVQGLETVTQDFSRVLKHELTHSFVQQITLGRCPTWLHEGLAQWEEGRRSNGSAAPLLAAYDSGKFIPLSHLGGSWTAMPSPVAVFAYAWSLAAVESIMTQSGSYGLQRLLEKLTTEPSAQSAIGQALQTSYGDLDRQTAEYLRQAYK